MQNPSFKKESLEDEMRNLKKCFTFLVVLLIFPVFVYAQSILIWDNDNNSDFLDPEGAGYVGCEYGIQQALAANGLSYSTVYTLPADLSIYDVVFVTLGIYCVG